MMGNVNLGDDPDVPVKINIDLGQFLTMNQSKLRNPGTRRVEIMLTYPNQYDLEHDSPTSGITLMGVNYVNIIFKKRDKNE